MNESVPNPSAQAQDNIVKDIHFASDNTVFTFAPVQIGTKIETQIVQISVDVITQKPLVKTSPYKGLKRFNFGDRDRFFGRDHLIAQLLQAVNQSSFSLVLGASGSGKSSVVRAGVIPELKKSLESVTQFYDFVLTPNNDPFDSLYRCLLSEEKDYSFRQADVEIAKKVGADTLSRVISELKRDNERWLIFIDQFEELFTLCQDVETRKSFIEGIVQVANSGDSSIRLVLAMRADFLEQFSFYPTLGALANQSNIHLVTEMHPDELCQAIEQPAALNGVVFEEGLVKQIIRDVEGQSGYLPLLQYTLNLLWETECRTFGADSRLNIEDQVLNRSSYAELEGVRGALQKRVNEIYKNLSQEQQTATKQIFVRLVNIVETDAGNKTVSRRAYRDEFSGSSVENTLNQFVDDNLLVSNYEYSTEQPFSSQGSKVRQRATVEIAHEILLSSWDTLKRWLEEEKEAIILKNWLANETNQWFKSSLKNDSRANDDLLKGSRLEQILDFRDKGAFEKLGGLSPKEVEFVAASVEWRDRLRREAEEQEQRELNLIKEALEQEKRAAAQERKARKANQGILLTVIASLLIIGTTGGFAWWQWTQQRFARVIRDASLGIARPELLPVIEDLRQQADDLASANNVDDALSNYRAVLNFISLLRKQSQEDAVNTPIDSSKLDSLYEETEKALVVLIEKARLPLLEKQLQNQQFGEVRSDLQEVKDPEDSFTEALLTTYALLMGDLGAGADINRNGAIDNTFEANRIPKQLLQDVEQAWRNATNKRCGWYDANSSYRSFTCSELDGQTLTAIIFGIPYEPVIYRLNEIPIAPKPMDPYN